MNSYKLKDLLSIKNGKDHKELNDGNIPIFGSGGIMRYGDKALFEDESILLPRKGTLSNIQYVNEPFWTVDTIYYSVVNKNLANPFYLFNYLKSLDLSNLNSGTGVPSMTFNSYYDLHIKLPDLSTQKSIAKVLSDLDAKIELNNRINRELEAMAKTLYDYWFVQFDYPDENGKPYKSSGGAMVYNSELKREIPEGWEVKELGELIDIQRGISYNSSDITGGGIPMISLNSFNLDGTYKAVGIKTYSGKYTEKQIAKSDDLLIAATDVTRNADIIGKAIMVPRYYKDDIVFSMDIAKIIPQKEISSPYLMMLFNSDHYHNYIKWYAAGTIVLHLIMDGVKWYKAEIPPIDLIKKFDTFYLPIANRINETGRQIEQLTALRDWLLPMLMNGQVTVRQAGNAVKEAEESLSMAAEPSVEYKKG